MTDQPSLRTDFMGLHMAGRFLSIEEAARQLGVDVDEVNRLVDRKKLFPIRDGTTLKFKVDEIERVAGQLGEESSRFDGLSLDLDASGPGGSSATGSGPAVPALSGIEVDDIALGEPLAIDIDDDGSIFDEAAPAAGPSTSHTLAPGEAAVSGLASAVSGLSIPSLGGADVSGAEVLFGDSAAGGGDSEELALESIVGASSPSLAGTSSPSVAGRSLPLDEGTVAIDIGGSAAIPMDPSGGSLAVGSGLGLAGGSNATGAGAALSGVLDSGLSLEDGDAALSGLGASGIDLGGDSGIAEAGADGATMLVSDDFELGGLGGDEESASVVIAAEETGDSSFLTEAMGGAGSSFSDDSSAAASLASASEAIDFPHEMAFDIRFSVWQICGLVCCSLVLLAGGFVALDLVRTVGTTAGGSPANALVEGMAGAFGWR